MKDTTQLYTHQISKADRDSMIEIFGSWESYLRSLPSRYWIKSGNGLWSSIPRNEAKLVEVV